MSLMEIQEGLKEAVTEGECVDYRIILHVRGKVYYHICNENQHDKENAKQLATRVAVSSNFRTYLPFDLPLKHHEGIFYCSVVWPLLALRILKVDTEAVIENVQLGLAQLAKQQIADPHMDVGYSGEG